MLDRQLPFLVAAVAVAVVANVAPGAPQLGTANDKLNHMLAFAILAPLALFAFPRRGVASVFVGLAFFNAGIEVTQALLCLGREPDPFDWAAGVVATIPCLAAVGLYRLYRVT